MRYSARTVTESTHHHIDMADHKQESHNSGEEDAEKRPGRDGGDDIHQHIQLLTGHAQRSARGVIYQHESSQKAVWSGRQLTSVPTAFSRGSKVAAASLANLSGAGTTRFRRLTCRALWNTVVCELEITSWWSRCEAKALCGKRRHTHPASARIRTMMRSTQCPHSAAVSCVLRGVTKKQQTLCEEPRASRDSLLLEVPSLGLHDGTTQAQRIRSRGHHTLDHTGYQPHREGSL